MKRLLNLPTLQTVAKEERTIKRPEKSALLRSNVGSMRTMDIVGLGTLVSMPTPRTPASNSTNMEVVIEALSVLFSTLGRTVDIG